MRKPLIESDSRKGHNLVNKPHRVALPSEVAFLDKFCDMRPSVVMKQNHFMPSRFIFRSFFVQCSAQTDNLFSVEIPCDCLIRFQQLVVHYTLLILSNTEHCLLSADVPLWRRCRWLAWIANGFSAFGVIEIDSIFHRQSQFGAKSPFFVT